MFYDDCEDPDYDYYELVDDDPEFWELVIKRAIVRQGPDYSEYRSCMWD